MTFGSLFAGVGGFDLGFSSAGMRRVWEVDITRGRDIHAETADTLSPVDLICGGPPCQKTSHAASFHRKRTGVSLWPEMLRIVNAMRPKWVVLEQPKGGKDVIIDAAQVLQLLGYGCAGRIVDSRHWVPQTRSRWFLIGRLGVNGMALWHLLYPDSERMEGGEQCHAAFTESWTSQKGEQGSVYAGACPDCMPGGIYSRISARKSALIGAGNAVSPPVAMWLGNRIMTANAKILEGK